MDRCCEETGQAVLPRSEAVPAWVAAAQAKVGAKEGRDECRTWPVSTSGESRSKGAPLPDLTPTAWAGPGGAALGGQGGLGLSRLRQHAAFTPAAAFNRQDVCS